jgi:hypothetical protein
MFTSRLDDTKSFKLKDIPPNPSVFERSIAKTAMTSRDRFSSTSSHKDNPFGDATFRVRPVAPKINLTQQRAGALKDLFQNFEGFIRGMIERGEDITSEEDLYLRYLSEYLNEDEEDIKHFKRIEIVADTTNLSLQTLGETLKELQELKLNGSIIRSISSLGTSYKALRVLWISRVGLKDLNGLLPLQNLEELYASYNYVKDISDVEYIPRLRILDLEANQIEELRQLTYLPPNLKSITLTGNEVTNNPEYMQTLLKYGAGLETIDDVAVGNINADINSPRTASKKVLEDDKKIVEELKKYGVSEDMVRESILLADELLKAEPTQEEILRQSIRIGNTKHALKDSVLGDKTEGESGVRLKTACVTSRRNVRTAHGKLEEGGKNRVETYSELVSNTDTVFAGNPIKAAKQKRLQANDKLKIMNIYELIEQFKPEVKENELNENTRDEIKAEKPKERITVKLCKSSLETIKPQRTELGILTTRKGETKVEAKPRIEELKAIKGTNKGLAGAIPKSREVIIKRIKRIKKL